VSSRKAVVISPLQTSKTAVPSPVQIEPLLVTTARAAELLSVSPWEVRRLCRKDLLAYKRLSKTNWLIVVQSLKKFASAA
jgi:hypothetical protein